MRNINLKRIGRISRLQIRETRIIEYISPVIATVVLILMSGFINDSWDDRMEDIVMMALVLTFLTAVITPFTQLISSNGPLTKMMLPASCMEKYLACWTTSIYRCIYWLVGVSLTLGVFLGIGKLTGIEGLPCTAQEMTEIVMTQDPLSYLLLPPIIILFTIATATPRKIRNMANIFGSIIILIVFGLGGLENHFPDGDLPMWVDITLGSILSIVPLVWSYVILKYVQPKNTDNLEHIF